MVSLHNTTNSVSTISHTYGQCICVLIQSNFYEFHCLEGMGEWMGGGGGGGVDWLRKALNVCLTTYSNVISLSPFKIPSSMGGGCSVGSGVGGIC